jgi:hypothetical protein
MKGARVKSLYQGIFPPTFFIFPDLPVVHRTGLGSRLLGIKPRHSEGAIRKENTLPFLRPAVKPGYPWSDNVRTVEENFIMVVETNMPAATLMN